MATQVDRVHCPQTEASLFCAALWDQRNIYWRSTKGHGQTCFEQMNSLIGPPFLPLWHGKWYRAMASFWACITTLGASNQAKSSFGRETALWTRCKPLCRTLWPPSGWVQERWARSTAWWTSWSLILELLKLRPCREMEAIHRPVDRFVAASDAALEAPPPLPKNRRLFDVLVQWCHSNPVRGPSLYPTVTWQWFAYALSRVICWSTLHVIAGGDLAKQLSNPWGHGERLFFHFKSCWWQVGIVWPSEAMPRDGSGACSYQGGCRWIQHGF